MPGDIGKVAFHIFHDSVILKTPYFTAYVFLFHAFPFGITRSVDIIRKNAGGFSLWRPRRNNVIAILKKLEGNQESFSAVPVATRCQSFYFSYIESFLFTTLFLSIPRFTHSV